MRVELRPIDEVRPYHRNPRRRPSVEAVRRSIEAYGFRQPIVIDEGGVIVVGHGRYHAAVELGYREVPVHVAEGLTPEQVRAYRLADNRTAEESGWDDSLLRLELAELDLAGSDLRDTGFTDPELARLRLDPDDLDPEPGPREGDEVYGGATSIARGSVPLRHWREQGHLDGLGAEDVLDFGCGQDAHEFARYDFVHAPEHGLLARTWRVVLCTYVLNVQPADHLVIQTAALLARLTRSDGVCLIATVNDPQLGGTDACGRREFKPAEFYDRVLGYYFEVEQVESAKFFGFRCTPKGVG